MQVYLEDDLSNFKTRFLQLLCGYLEIEERNIGKIIFANAKTKESLSFPGRTPLNRRLRSQDFLVHCFISASLWKDISKPTNSTHLVLIFVLLDCSQKRVYNIGGVAL